MLCMHALVAPKALSLTSTPQAGLGKHIAAGREIHKVKSAVEQVVPCMYIHTVVAAVLHKLSKVTQPVGRGSAWHPLKHSPQAN